MGSYFRFMAICKYQNESKHSMVRKFQHWRYRDGFAFGMMFGFVSLAFLTWNFEYTIKTITVSLTQLVITGIYLVSIGMGIFGSYRKDYVFGARGDAMIYGFILFYTIVAVAFNVYHGKLPLPY